MKSLVISVFIIGCASAFELHHVKSSYPNGIKWEFGDGKLNKHTFIKSFPTSVHQSHPSRVYPASEGRLHHDQPATGPFRDSHVDLPKHIDSTRNQEIHETPYAITYYQPGSQTLESGLGNDVQPVHSADYRTHYKPQDGYHYPRPVHQHC